MMQQKDKKIQQLATKLVEAEEKIEQLESRLTRHL
jgi:predicted RNase H-like nuclease (RuvC/YqgF family)